MSWRAAVAGAGQVSWPGSSPAARAAAGSGCGAGLSQRAPRLGIAIAAVIVLNAGFAFAQEMQAERAAEALAAFLPDRAWALRAGTRREIDARLPVPGDVLLIEEGERICADARLITGTVEVDLSTLTGESVPVTRTVGAANAGTPLLQAEDVVFSGKACTDGEAQAVVTATGMGSELGRIAALSATGWPRTPAVSADPGQFLLDGAGRAPGPVGPAASDLGPWHRVRSRLTVRATAVAFARRRPPWLIAQCAR